MVSSGAADEFGKMSFLSIPMLLQFFSSEKVSRQIFMNFEFTVLFKIIAPRSRKKNPHFWKDTIFSDKKNEQNLNCILLPMVAADQANPSNSLSISIRLIFFIILSLRSEERGLMNCTPMPILSTLGDLFTQTTTAMTSAW